MQVRTDLAEEAQALWRQSAGKTTQLEGVKARSWEEHGVGRHQVQILNEQGEKAWASPGGPMRPCGCRETGGLRLRRQRP